MKMSAIDAMSTSEQDAFVQLIARVALDAALREADQDERPARLAHVAGRRDRRRTEGDDRDAR